MSDQIRVIGRPWPGYGNGEIQENSPPARSPFPPALDPTSWSVDLKRPLDDAASRRGAGFRLTAEGLAYLTIAVLAVLTRFWDLGSRAMNHDESLHTYYSWLYYDNYHYIHDPLMHGPALFHLNALAYFLFGDNDVTARIMPAIFGTMIVLMPALLRGPKLWGRWGAIAASGILLFSPSILYYSRFIRHDVYTLFATFAIVIAALRYLDKPERRWIIVAAISTFFLFTTKEVSFIVAFIVVTFLAVVVTWQIHRAMFGVLVGSVIALGVVLLGLRSMGVEPLPGIPWEDPSDRNISAFATDFAQHPYVLAALGVIGLAIVAALIVADRLRTEGGRWLDDVIGRTPDHTTAHSLYLALRDYRGLAIGIGAGLTLFVLLYTSMFTNFGGLGSATFGALGYWLGQQDVQRGAQPWFYYLLLLPQYEFVAVTVFPIAGLLTAWGLVTRIRGGDYFLGRPVGRRLYMRAFFLYWAVVMLGVLSWAGEKMPWLSVHIALPMILLAASYTGEAVEYVEARAREGRLPGRSALAVAAGIPVLTASWFLLWAWASAGPWEFREDLNNYVRTLRPFAADNPWVLYLPLAALVALLGYGLYRLGPKLALATAGAAIVAVMIAGQAHVSYRFTYTEGDVAIDMLMYSQASPDVERVMDDLGEFSRQMTGDRDIAVMYDSGTSWPFQWYLRDYPNRRFYGSTIDSPPNAEVILISQDTWPDNLDMLSGYTYQDYTMRWFFPENPTYRRFAIAPELNDESRQNYQTDEYPPYWAGDVAESVFDSFWSLRDPQQQAKMFRLV
ncbi:MAG: TIGR03663 family protein, partial [Thermomicrobiales bacterium]